MLRASVFGLSLVLCTGSALAQQVPGLCGDRRDMQAELAQNFDQRPVGSAVVGSSVLVELMMSDSGSWSLLLSFLDGSSCLVDQSGAGERLPPAPFVRKR